MTLARVVAGVPLALALLGSAGFARSAGPAPLPFVPSIPHVRLEVARDHLVVVEDVALVPSGWRSGDLDLFVAFGAPGAPRAVDAHLLALPDGALEAPSADIGEPILRSPAPRRPPAAIPLLGRPQMAGTVLHVTESALRRALSGGGLAVIRLRTLVPLPAKDFEAARGIVVRLGIADGAPLTIGRIDITATPGRVPPSRAEASLCGPGADTSPLAISVRGEAEPPTPHARRIAPVLATRHATDDLCIRYWD